MPEPNIQYSVEFPDGKRANISKEVYESTKDNLYSKYPEAKVVRTSVYQPDDDDIADSDQYAISFGGNRAVISNQAFQETKDSLLAQYPDAQITKMRDESAAYWEPRRQAAMAKLDELDKQNGDFMRQYNANKTVADLLENDGVVASGQHDFVAENKAQYDTLDRQRRELLEQYYSNPNTIREYREGASRAGNLYDTYMEKAYAAETGEERRDWKRAAKLQDDIRKVYEAPNKYTDGDASNGFFQYLSDYAKGAGDVFSDKDFYTRGFTEIARNFDLRGIAKKIEEASNAKGGDLSESDIDRIISPSEKAELMSFYALSEAQRERADSISSAYRAGSSFADSVGYMAEFLLSSGLGNLAGKAMSGSSRALTSWLGKQLMSDHALRRAIAKGVTTAPQYGSKAAKVLTEAAVKPLVQGIWHTGTQISSLANISEGLLETNSNGELVSVGHAILKRGVDSVIENWSESVGGALEAGLAAPFKAAGWLGEKTLGGTSFARAARWLYESGPAQVLFEAGFNGMLGEIAEEWVGNATRVAFGLMSKDEFKDFASFRQQAEMAASFAPMSLIGLGSSTMAAYRKSNQFKAVSGKVKGILQKQGVPDGEIEELFNTKFDTAEDIGRKVAPYLYNAHQANNADDYKTILQFIELAGREAVFEEFDKVEKEQERSTMQEQIAAGAGQFWYDTPDNGSQVRVVETDGKTYYILGEGVDGTYAAISSDGERKVFSADRLAAGAQDGTLTDTNMALEDYLQQRVDASKKTAEAERMNREANEQLAAVKAQIAAKPEVNLGTREAPVLAAVIASDNTGVMVAWDDEEGNYREQPLTWNEVANKLQTPIDVRTDEQLENDAAAALDDARARVAQYQKITPGTEIRVDLPELGEATYRFQKAIVDEGQVIIYAEDENGESKQFTEEMVVDLPGLLAQEDAATAVNVPEEGTNVVFTDENGDPVKGVVSVKDNGSGFTSVVTPAGDTVVIETARVEQDAAPAQEPEDDGVLRDFRGNPIPMIESGEDAGEVDLDAFFDRDTEAWARWNDEQRGDGGADSRQNIEVALKAVQKTIKTAQKEHDATASPNKRRKQEQAIATLVQRAEQLQGLIDGYVAREEAAKAEEEARRAAAESEAAAAEEVAEAPAEAVAEEAPMEETPAPVEPEYNPDPEVAAAEAQVDLNPTDAQKEAGNYQKGHVVIDGHDITIENPKGSVRSGVDADGNPWSVTMNNTYGYIRRTEGVDGDQIDVFLSDNPTEGNVYVVDQVKPDGSFDEHKVMYGFASAEEAQAAYLANYSPGWKGLGVITEVSKEEFAKWLDSSTRKTKPFSEYKSVEASGAQNQAQQPMKINVVETITPQGIIDLYNSKDETSEDKGKPGRKEILNALYEANPQLVQFRNEADQQNAVSDVIALARQFPDLAISKRILGSVKTAWVVAEQQEIAPAEEAVAAPAPAEETAPSQPEAAPAAEAESAELTDAQKQVMEFAGVDQQALALAEEKRQAPLQERLAKWRSVIGDVVTVLTSIDDVMAIENKATRDEFLAAKAAGETVHGFYDPTTKKAYLFLPDIRNTRELDRKVLHEVISHKGLAGVMGEEGFNAFLDRVWNDMMDADSRKEFLGYVNGSEDSVASRRHAADEYVAHVAEHNTSIIKQLDETAWDKFVNAVKEIINDMIGDDFFDTGVWTPFDKELAQAFNQYRTESGLKFQEQVNAPTGQKSADAVSETRFSLTRESQLRNDSEAFLRKLEKKPISEKDLKVGSDAIGSMVDYMLPYLDKVKEGKRYMPEEIFGKEWSTIFTNGSYGRTMENTLICMRTLAYNDFVNTVQDKIGRPLTPTESFLASQMLYDIATDPQCLYCYVALDRKAYNGFLKIYIEQRDAVLDKYKADESIDRTYRLPEQEKDKKKRKKLAGNNPVAKLYLEYLQGRADTPSMRERFNAWLDYIAEGSLIKMSDVTSPSKRQKVALRGESYAKQIADAENYAQAASWAKKQEEYRAYNGELLTMPQTTVDLLNKEYGLRFYSFSEYSPAFIVENMQMVRDAALRSLVGLAYTKEIDFAKIFAPTGININISTYGREAEDGTVVMDTKQGADWQEAQALREQYGNVGVVFVAVNDKMVEWAIDQPWIDVVIPFHIVRTGADIASFYDWTNYSSMQADKGKKGRSTYLVPTEHKNDKDTFLALCEKRGLKPRFADLIIPSTGKSVVEHPNYMKLVNETRRSVKETVRLKPVFNLDEARRSFSEFVEKGGYYGGWFVDDEAFEKGVEQVSGDVLAGKTAKDVDYGRQDIKMSADKLAEIAMKRSRPRSHQKAPLTKAQRNVLNFINGRTESEGNTRFSKTNQTENGFISNAQAALGQIAMEKATPQQWIKMLTDKGGMKAGEDKWLGLSDWLKASDKKTVTKQEISDFIDQNHIQIEEEKYGVIENSEAFQKYDSEYNLLVETAPERTQAIEDELTAFWDEMRDKYGEDFEYSMTGGESTNEGNLIDARDMWRDDPKQAAYEEMVDKYGDDFRLAFDYLDVFGEGLTVEDKDAAAFFLGIKPIDNIRLGYTTDGLENKREIAMTVPMIESWNENDSIHFGDAGNGRAVAWVRFGDAKQNTGFKEAKRRYDEAADAFGKYRDMIISKYSLRATSTKNTMDLATPEENEKVRGLYKEMLERQYEMKHGQHRIEKVLFIDEIQSKRHQEARENGGYRDDAALKRAQKRMADAYDAWSEYNKKLLEKYGVLDFDEKRNQEEEAEWIRLYRDYRDAENAVRRNGFDPMEDETYRKIKEEQYAFEHGGEFQRLMEDWKKAEGNDARSAIDEKLKPFQKTNREYFEALEERERVLADEFNASHKSDIPSAPFEKNWHELAMKRMLRLAAEEGYDYVAWTTGEQQAERYSLSQHVSEIAVKAVGDNKYRVVIEDSYGSELEDYRGSGKEMDAKGLSELVGKELATRLITGAEQSKGKEWYGKGKNPEYFTIKGDDLRIGGEGMKGFYDGILVNFMNKYGKKWGIQVEDINLPDLEESARTAHAVRVTPEMKESVLQGQLMFSRVTPEQDKEYLDAVKAGDMDKARKVYDEAREATGYTIRGFHGGPVQFNVYDKDKRGRTTGARSAKLGFFFSETSDVADRFRDYSLDMGENFEDIKESIEKQFNSVPQKLINKFFDDYKNEDVNLYASYTYDDYIDDCGDNGEEPSDIGYIKKVMRKELNPDVPVDSAKREFAQFVFFKRMDEGEWDEWDQIKDFLSENFGIKVGHTQEVYLKITNPLVDEIERDYYNHSGIMEERMSSVIERAMKNGNDGVIFTKVSEMGMEPEAQYVVFDSNQIKSADPVTYDDAGNVIPLSERFNESNPDIRFSKAYHGTGADFDAFDHSHMSEGEGNQAYGWGTYVAFNREVGLAYARSIGGSDDQYERGIRSIENQQARDRMSLEKAKNDAEKRYYEDAIALADQRKEQIKRHLYTVEIPDDDGYNYLHWDEPITAEQSRRIMDLVRENVEDKDAWGDMFEYELQSTLGYGTFGRHVLGGMDYFLGNLYNYETDEDPGAERNSKLLRSIGIVGMVHPAHGVNGEELEDEPNVVIYDEKDLKITDHLRFSRAYHGSGADFEMFDLSHVGEGEGAAAHGYGVYVTFNMKTAQGYADKLSGISREERNQRNEELERLRNEMRRVRELEKDREERLREDAEDAEDPDEKARLLNKADALANEGGSHYKSLQRVYRHKQLLLAAKDSYITYKDVTVDTPVNKLANIADATRMIFFAGSYEGALEQYKRHEVGEPGVGYYDAYQFLKSTTPEDWVTHRNLYSVEIPEDNGDNYLDEDAEPSVNQCYRIFMGLIERRDGSYGKFMMIPQSISTASGRGIYRSLTDVLGGKKNASDFLQSVGFDGIKYEGEVDGPCAVIFDDDVVSIAEHIRFSKRTKPAPTKTGIGYKVFFRGKDGKLYPPMVANPDGADTPIGVWLDADAAPVAGKSKTGRLRVKSGGKGTQGGSGSRLAYRPGWHLVEIPYAIQFNRLNPETGQKDLFPADFVWAEVEYAADKDYQSEADAEGTTKSGKYQHSLAGLKKVPEDGFYRYRTNPNPETDPWIITGAMKVNRVLTNEEVDELVRKAGREPQKREPEVRFSKESAGDILDRYENQDGSEEYPWMSESEMIDRIESELPYGINTEEIFSLIDKYRRLDAEDFDEGRRDFSGSERDEVFNDIVDALREYSKGDVRFSREVPVREEGESVVDFYNRSISQIRSRYKLLSKAFVPGPERNNYSVGGYRKDMDVIRILARDKYSYEDYEEIYFHENLHAYNHKNGFSGKSAGILELIESFRKLNPALIAHHEELIRNDKEYEGRDIQEELSTRILSSWMVRGIGNNGFAKLSNSSKDYVDGYLNALGYDRTRERTERYSGGTGDGRSVGYSGEDGASIHVESGASERRQRSPREIAYDVDRGGIKAVVGEDNVSDFYNGLYRAMPEQLRAGIVSRAEDAGWNFHEALKGRLAELALAGNDETGLLRLAERMLSDYYGHPIDEATARYILWRTAQPNDSLTDIQKTALKRRWKVGEKDTDVRFSRAQFKAAFPDTKVVDENGEPLVVYHGTIDDFNVFERDKTEFGGFHFSSSKDGAMEAAMNKIYDRYGLDPEDIDDVKEAKQIAKQRVKIIPAFLNIKNLIRVDDESANDIAMGRKDGDISDESGYVYTNDVEGAGTDSYMVFSSNQIKLASLVTYDDNGNPIPSSRRYDPDSNDIRFSRVTPEQDKEYMDAVKAGDMAKAQELVNEAAERAMPNTKVVDENGKPLVVYHGGYFGHMEDAFEGINPFAFNTADHNGWFSPDRGYASNYINEDDREPIAVFLNIRNPFDMGNVQRLIVEDGVPTALAREYADKLGVSVGDITDGLVETDYVDYFEGENGPNVPAFAINRNPEFAELLVRKGYDGAKSIEPGGNIGYMVTSPNQIKSADPVTYDDAGNVIPLSERFNENNPDIRFSKGDLGRRLEETSQVVGVIADGAKESLDQQKKALKGELRTVARAMSAQKVYDRSTVDTITGLAKQVLKDQEIETMSRREIARLMGLIRTSVGKAPRTVKHNADILLDIIIDNLLRTEENRLAAIVRTGASRTNASGVEVQGKLDVRGQNVLKAYRAGLDMPVGKPDDDETEGTVYARLAVLQERLDSEDDAVRAEAEAEYDGLTMALEYHENIKASRNEERSLRDDMAEAAEEARRGGMSRAAYNEYVEDTQSALRENRVDRIESFRELRIKLAELIEGSKTNAAAFRQRERDRINAIHHLANSDMQGRTADQDKRTGRLGNFLNSSLVRFFTSPLATFDQMLRAFGSKSVNGQGYLWNKYMREWIEARENEIKGTMEAKQALDRKASEVFGKEMIWSDIYDIVRKMPKAKVKWWSGGAMQDHELTQGQLLYIYMVNKMADGRMKLRRMGISEEDVQAIRNQMDERFITLADWLQDEFLVGLRNKYNAVHERLFGASMAAIEDYFPLVINKRSLNKQEDIAAEDNGDTLPATTTGSIIKRRRNSRNLDLLNADAFDVVIRHIEQMERWAAFAEYNRDLNTLLSYNRFRNQVKNMETIYGTGDVLWKNFRNVSRIAGNTYRPTVKSESLDSAAVNLAKGVTAAKINFRVYTAMKQFLSMPAFLADANIGKLAGAIAHQQQSWKWAMENLPLFESRWKSRIAGDTRLMNTDSDWKLFRSRAYDKLSKMGMSPNAFVDALTVSIGAKALYDTKYERYIEDGYTEEQAAKKAKQDATILYNETQQSSEGAFVSTVQLDRTLLSTMISVFRNSSMGFQRQLHDALRNLARRTRSGYREESLEFMTKQGVRDGLTEEQAASAAEREYNRGMWHDMARVATFGMVVQFAWNLGASLAYLLFGDDDDKKEEMVREAFIHSLFGSIEGLSGGNIMSEALNMVAKGESLRNYDPSLLPLISDMKRIYSMAGYDKVAAFNSLVNLAVQAGIGANPETISDAVVAVVDASKGDLGVANEAMLLILRVLQVPQSQLDEIYIDELGMNARSARRLNYKQMADRYAKYKIAREAGAMSGLYSDEKRKAREESRKKTFQKKVNERKKLNK